MTARQQGREIPMEPQNMTFGAVLARLDDGLIWNHSVYLSDPHNLRPRRCVSSSMLTQQSMEKTTIPRS